MDTIAISDFRNNLPSIIGDINAYTKRVIVSVSGKPKAVVLSLDELESLEETAEILSAPKAWKKIQTSRKQAHKRQGVALKDLD